MQSHKQQQKKDPDISSFSHNELNNIPKEHAQLNPSLLPKLQILNRELPLLETKALNS